MSSLQSEGNSLSELIALLKNSDYCVRIKAARQLGEMADERALEPLMQALKDGDEWVAIEATKALGKIGSPRAIPALIKVLHSKEWCSEIDDLMRQGEDNDNDVQVSHLAVATVQIAQDINALRAAAATALGKIGSSEAVAALKSVLTDGHITAPKKEALAALRNIADYPL